MSYSSVGRWFLPRLVERKHRWGQADRKPFNHSRGASSAWGWQRLCGKGLLQLNTPTLQIQPPGFLILSLIVLSVKDYHATSFRFWRILDFKILGLWMFKQESRCTHILISEKCSDLKHFWTKHFRHIYPVTEKLASSWEIDIWSMGHLNIFQNLKEKNLWSLKIHVSIQPNQHLKWKAPAVESYGNSY